MNWNIPENHSKLWTEEERQEAILLHDCGKTWAQVADILGRSEHAVLACLRKYKRTWSEEEIQNMLEWKEAGISSAEIAVRLDRTTGAVATKVSCLLRDSLSKKRPAKFAGIAGWGPFLNWHGTRE